MNPETLNIETAPVETFIMGDSPRGAWTMTVVEVEAEVTGAKIRKVEAEIQGKVCVINMRKAARFLAQPQLEIIGAW